MSIFDFNDNGTTDFWEAGLAGSVLGDYAVTSAAATDLAKLCDELQERVRLQQEALDAALEVIDGLREQVDDYEGQLAERDERDVEEIGRLEERIEELEGLLEERDEELADLREELREAEAAQYDRL